MFQWLFDEATRTYEALITTYATLDYHLVEIPRLPLGDRGRFILDRGGLNARG